jgi:amino acid adenylation domain-containing protein
LTAIYRNHYTFKQAAKWILLYFEQNGRCHFIQTPIRSIKIHKDTIHERIAAQAKQTPTALAAQSDEQTLTYGELNDRSNQLAHYLRESGVTAEQRVALCLNRSVDVLIAIVAILKSGAAYVPLDSKQPTNRLAYILNDSNAVMIITSSHLSHTFMGLQHRLMIYDTPQILSTYPTTPLDNTVSANHLAYVIYTSGTTGKPKGVLIEHQSVVNYCDWFESYSATTPQSRIDWSCNYIFDMAITSTIVPLMLGATVVICSEIIQRQFQRYLHHLNTHQITLIKITPSYFKELLREIQTNPIALDDLRMIILGGESLRAIDCIDWLKQYPKHSLINEYGPTEVTVASSHFLINTQTTLLPDAPVPIGKPGAHMQYTIMDAHQQQVPMGEEGELYIGGRGLARGYLNAPELTQSRFIHKKTDDGSRLYKTGDRCRQLPNGAFEYLDRIDRQVKIRGFRVELSEVEQCLQEHPCIQDAVVIVHHNTRQEPQLLAYYLLNQSTQTVTQRHLHQHMQANLPHYMIPTSFIQMQRFPLAANGKLDYALLPKQTLNTRTPSKPRSKTERILLDIWATELDAPDLGIDDNFWEWGGHSLMAARIISKINQVLDKHIMEHQFYEAMTIRKLNDILKKTSGNNHLNPNPSLKHTLKKIPLSDFQTLLWTTKTFKPKAAKLQIVSRKRMQGAFNRQALDYAFDCVIQQHNIFSHQIQTYLPTQSFLKRKPVFIIEKNLETLSISDTETVLREAMQELIHLSSWPKNFALIQARLFQLQQDCVELQLAIPHIISDAISIELLFFELSTYYQRYLQHATQTKRLPNEVQFTDYIIEEHVQTQTRLEKDLDFWTSYLKDAHLFAFPDASISKQTNKSFTYSTYVPIPNKAIHHLEAFCIQQQVSLSDALCATIGLSLRNCCDGSFDANEPVLMHIVKSARDKMTYDRTIGCFIRVEAIKLFLNKQQTLRSLSKYIHAFMVKNIIFQHASTSLKFASLNPFYRKKKNILYYLTRLFAWVCTKTNRANNINPIFLQLCPKLSRLDGQNRFMIYLNIWNNFIKPNSDNDQLFGLQAKPVAMHQYDLLTIDYLFEVCFMRDENNDRPYVVISSNLKPAFREQIAYELLRMMNEEMVLSMKTNVQHA